ncbi:MAG: Holliday junction resolvase RuvX [Patescibacteria group bacterium]
MRFLGIDYGSKRVGLAVSDPSGKFALPHSVIENSVNLDEAVRKICMANEVETVVLGESKDFSGEDNSIMEEIRNFAEQLKSNGLSVVLEPEHFSSLAASRFQGNIEKLDSSAAAIILQSYLDRKNG